MTFLRDLIAPTWYDAGGNEIAAADAVQVSGLTVAHTGGRIYLTALATLPAPADPGDDGKWLQATGSGAAGWVTLPIDDPADPGDNGKFAVASSGSYVATSFALSHIPTVGGDSGKFLRSNGSSVSMQSIVATDLAAAERATIAGSVDYSGVVYTTDATPLNTSIGTIASGNSYRVAASVVADDDTDLAFIEKVWWVKVKSGVATVNTPADSADNVDDIGGLDVSLVVTGVSPFFTLNLTVTGLAATNIGWSYRVARQTVALPGATA